MFTGLIENVGVLKRRSLHGQAGALEVGTDLPLEEIHSGDSIAVNGACLTVETINLANRSLMFHTLAETLARTNLGTLPIGAALNLERALQAGARLGGHFVSGHIDITAAVTTISTASNDVVLTIKLPAELQALVIPKGSIAVNGISLTVASLASDTFSLHIIPHTWQQTNLSSLKPGDAVNLEADMVGKYILRWQNLSHSGRVNMKTLDDAGFLEG
jgi:riboflavin synthase